jgi:hypothetical protein
MNQFQNELEKLNNMRQDYDAIRLEIMAMESDLDSKKQANQLKIQTDIMNGVRVDYSKQDAEVGRVETKLIGLREYWDSLARVIEIQSKEILPKVDREVKAQRLVAMNQELKNLVESFDINKLNEVNQSIKQIYDYAATIGNECSFSGYVFDGYNPPCELRYLGNYQSLTNINLSVVGLFDFLNKHLETSEVLLGELEQSCQDYLKSGKTIPNF